jgi:hypothetical protein
LYCRAKPNLHLEREKVIKFTKQQNTMTHSATS